MKRQFRFTKRALDALPPCPENSKAKEIEYSDLEVAGLKVLCNRIGRKSFLFRYVFDGRKRSMKVGGYPETEITDARMKVIEWRALLAKGIDPQEAIQQAERSRLTFQRFFDDYLWQHWKSTKRSAKADRSRWENHVLPIFGTKLLTWPRPSICNPFTTARRRNSHPLRQTASWRRSSGRSTWPSHGACCDRSRTRRTR